MGSQGGMHNLTTLIKRLEAATSRLEDIASSTGPADGAKPGTNAAALSRAGSINGDSTTPTQAAHTQSSQQSRAAPEADLPPAIADFDSMIKDDLSFFSELSSKIGGVIEEQARYFSTAFKAQRNVIQIASKAKKPAETSPVFMEVFKDLVKGSEQVGAVRDNNRQSPQGSHLAMVGDGVAVLFWVVQPAKPDEYVGEVLGGARTYGNRILTEHRNKNQLHVDWVTAFVKLCGSLKSHIKQHYPRGLVWNANGVPAEEAIKQTQNQAQANGVSSSVPPLAAGGPPPPPPLPPAFDKSDGTSHHASPSSSTNNMGAIFADLNKGESVTSGLRKVDKNQMTHKNPSLRAQAPSETLSRSDSNSSGRGPSPTPNKKPNNMRTKKPARKELEGNKWTIEHFESESTPITIDAERQQSILVTRCKSATLVINGKANAITIDNCSRVDMIVDTLVSSIEVINCSNFRVQVMGSLPSVQLDKVDGAAVILGKNSLHTEVYTSKCSSINVDLPPASEADDSIECPIPEQFRSYVRNGQLITEIVRQEG